MPVGDQQHRGMPVVPAVALSRLDQTFTSASVRYSRRAQVGVIEPDWQDCLRLAVANIAFNPLIDFRSKSASTSARRWYYISCIASGARF